MMSEIPPAQHVFFDKEDKILRFYDREKELKELYKFWNFTDIESSIIKIANMPGIGKTELALQFMRTYGMREKAMLIYINFGDILPAINKVNSLDNAYLITKKISNLLLPQLKWYYKLLNKSIPQELHDTIQESLSDKIAFDIFLDNIFNSEILRNTRKIIFFDEIQKLWGAGIESTLSEKQITEINEWYIKNPGKRISTKNRLYEINKRYEQGIFRDLIYLLKTLINEGVNISIVSGTQYRLLNSLDDIGSPISRRIRRLEFSRIPREKMEIWIEEYFPMPNNQELHEIWKELCATIVEYAGGIPGIMVGFLQALPDNNKQFLDNLKVNYDLYFNEYMKNVDNLLEEYIHNRINKLLDDFGDKAIIKLLSRIARHFMFHDATDETEIHAWIAEINWEDAIPDAADLVQIGLLLKGNGSLQTDYLNPHSEQLPISNPLILVSKYIHELLKERFLDKLWLQEMQINLNEELLHVLRISPSVVGFAFEYYLAKKLLQLSQYNLVLVENGKSDIFGDLSYIKDSQKLSISLNKLENIVSRQYVNKVPLQENIIYLVSQEMAIDGVIVLDDKILVYQAKFKKKVETLTNNFFENTDLITQQLQQRFNKPVYKMLFTLTVPTKPSVEKLRKREYMICSDLEKLLGKTMLNWLIASKNRKISL